MQTVSLAFVPADMDVSLAKRSFSECDHSDIHFPTFLNFKYLPLSQFHVISLIDFYITVLLVYNVYSKFAMIFNKDPNYGSHPL